MSDFFMRCGICNKDFTKREDADSHFNSNEHKQTLQNPQIVMKAVMKSQNDLLGRIRRGR